MILELFPQFLRRPRVMPLAAVFPRVDGLVGAPLLAPGAEGPVHELGPLCLLGPVTPHVACDGPMDGCRHGDLLDGLPFFDVSELAA